MITPADIANARFRVGMRGYNQDDVDAFLERVEQSLVDLIEQKADVEQRLERQTEAIAAQQRDTDAVVPLVAPPAPPEQRHAAPEPQVTEILALATEAARRHEEEAQARAQALLNQAQSHAGDIIRQAHAEADEIRRQADEEARQATSGLEATVALLEKRVGQLREVGDGHREKLRAWLQATLEEVERPLV